MVNMKRIDAVIIGLCIIAAAIIVGGIMGPARQHGQPPTREAGRYQIAGSSGVNVFVLDTKTWR